jgi:hypothetical protein
VKKMKSINGMLAGLGRLSDLPDVDDLSLATGLSRKDCVSVFGEAVAEDLSAFTTEPHGRGRAAHGHGLLFDLPAVKRVVASAPFREWHQSRLDLRTVRQVMES